MAAPGREDGPECTAAARTGRKPHWRRGEGAAEQPGVVLWMVLGGIDPPHEARGLDLWARSSALPTSECRGVGHGQTAATPAVCSLPPVCVT